MPDGPEQTMQQETPATPASTVGAGGAPSLITLTPKDLQDIVQGAIAGALATQGTIPPRQPQPTAPSLKKPDRPEIDLDCNESQWGFFISEWQHYKRRCHLTREEDTISELRSACSTALRKEIFDFVGASRLETLSEQQLLDQMKKLAVKGKNKSVHRQEFYSMKQEPGQPIQEFVAKHHSKSEHCQL